MTEFKPRGMKEPELRAAATCGVCSKKIGASGLPLFWRVRIERWGVKMNAVQRLDGLAMMLGGNAALTRAFSPGEDLAVEVMEPVTITVCETCACEKPFLVAAVIDRIRDDEDKSEEESYG